ncbi:hypothetical protein [Altererythrobacter lutimaris]|uniref:Negative modulator of initiation of replication SeqA N-terminal domain-containing protein n=1 Tax=Altererythrobacter lutimaris TaxID=2743979 RepID=A0A850H8Y6_9SPHN|nr:hypothetical protein [Altererythrobacter lutimaris]NVE93695.1 hypothetical protein [Altererythrobacter lutimaris]
MEMKQIEIDFEVYQAIEAERRSFSEPANAALRRLIGIESGYSDDDESFASLDDGAWSSKGVTLPEETSLRMEYNGSVKRAFISKGKWKTPRGIFNGPSPAAAAVATTKDGKTPTLNGWIYWRAKLPGTREWVPIQELRDKAKGR